MSAVVLCYIPPMNEQKRDVRLSARITANLYKKVVYKAKKMKWSISDTVEEALTRLLEK